MQNFGNCGFNPSEDSAIARELLAIYTMISSMEDAMLFKTIKLRVVS